MKLIAAIFAVFVTIGLVSTWFALKSFEVNVEELESPNKYSAFRLTIKNMFGPLDRNYTLFDLLPHKSHNLTLGSL